MGFSGVVAAAKERRTTEFHEAIERSFGRLRGGVWPVVQAAGAATLAWAIAATLLGHERPIVAAIAAVISVGAVSGQTLRRAVEWIFGVAVGLAVADLVMFLIGTGPLQTGVMVGLAMTVALMLRGGIMFWTEAGVSALLVANLDPTTYGTAPDRFIEALVGGGAALAVAGLFPGNPSLRIRRAARPVLRDLASAHRDAAAALREGDLELAEKALDEGRRIDGRVEELREELDGGFQIARFAPPRRRHLGHLEYYATAADQLDLAVRNTRVLARANVAAVRENGAGPENLSGAILYLARAVEALDGYLEDPGHPLDARYFAVEAAEEATSVLAARNDLETSVLVGQIRSTSVDLLQAAGMSHPEALDAIREVSRRSSEGRSSEASV